MLALRMDDELDKKVTALARRQGRNKSAIVREALVRYIEDQEDVELAETALRSMTGQKAMTHEEARRVLGLDD